HPHRARCRLRYQGSRRQEGIVFPGHHLSGGWSVQDFFWRVVCSPLAVQRRGGSTRGSWTIDSNSRGALTHLLDGKSRRSLYLQIERSLIRWKAQRGPDARGGGGGVA